MKHVPFLLVALFSTVATGASFTYDGDAFPEDVGWERISNLDPERSVQEGWLVQVFQAPGEQDFYRRSLTDIAGSETFFVEWQVETTAPSSLLELSQTPVVVSAFGSTSSTYHTTITDSRVQLYRDTGIPLVYVDIDAGVPHTYRVELHGTASYAWYIDGELVDSGVPEGPYPTESSFVIWGAEHDDPGHTTRWDFVRYGTIDAPIPAVSDWGLVIMTLLILVAGTVVIRSRCPNAMHGA